MDFLTFTRFGSISQFGFSHIAIWISSSRNLDISEKSVISHHLVILPSRNLDIPVLELYTNSTLTSTREMCISISDTWPIVDTVMNFYFNLICTRSKRDDNWPKVNVVPVELYTKFVGLGYDSVKGMTEGRNIFDCDLLFIPMKSYEEDESSDQGSKSIVLCALDMRLKKMTLYDTKIQRRTPNFLQGFHFVQKYLNQECQRIYHQPLLPDGPFNFTEAMDLPKAKKPFHSRIFTCLYAEFLSRGEHPRMTEEVFFYRLKIISEIYNKKIEHPRH